MPGGRGEPARVRWVKSPCNSARLGIGQPVLLLSYATARRNGAGLPPRRASCSRAPSQFLGGAGLVRDVQLHARRASRGAQHRGDRASVQAEPRCCAGLILQFVSSSSISSGIPGRSSAANAVRSARPCRRSAGSAPASRIACRTRLPRPPEHCGRRGRRRAVAPASAASRAIPATGSARRAGSMRTTLADFIGQQFAVDAGRNALEQRPRQLAEAARGRPRYVVSTCALRCLRKYSDSGIALLEPRFERFAAFLADQRIRIVAVRQEQEADLPALAHLAQRILQRAPGGGAAGAIAVEAEDQLRCRCGRRATDARASSQFPASRPRR